MARGRKLAEIKAERTNENQWHIWNQYTDETLAVIDMEDWHKQEFKEFGYKHQTKFMIDMVINKKWGSYEDIVKAGSLMVKLGLKDEAYNWNDKIRVENYKKHRENYFNQMCEGLERKHITNKVRVYKREYDKAGKRNLAKFESEIEKYNSYNESLKDLSEYKDLNRVLKTYKAHLGLLIEYGRKQLESNEKLKYKSKDKYTFSLSTRHFSAVLKDNNIEMSYSRVARLFSLFALLGFVNKEYDEAKRYKRTRKIDKHDITFLSLNQMDLGKANEIAEVLIANKYKLSNLSSTYVKKHFSQLESDKVFSEPNKTEVVLVKEIDVKIELIAVKNYRNDEPKTVLKPSQYFEYGLEEEIPF